MTPEARRATWQAVRRDLEQPARPHLAHKVPDSRGIVSAAAGPELLLNALLMVARLRHVGCTLPVQIFHGRGELVPERVRAAFGPGTSFVAIDDPSVASYAYKPEALLRTSFDLCLWLDADNCPLVDPTPLFERSDDALAWPDAFRFNRPVVYAVFDGFSREDPELESGQLWLRTRACADALGAAARLNGMYRQLVWADMLGDKDTFRLAFHACKRTLRLVAPAPTIVGTTARKLLPRRDAMGRLRLLSTRRRESALVQHALDGTPAFLHRTGSPWSLFADLKPVAWSTPLTAPISEPIQGWSPTHVQPVAQSVREADAWAAHKLDELAWIYGACGTPRWQLALRRVLWRRRLASRFTAAAGVAT